MKKAVLLALIGIGIVAASVAKASDVHRVMTAVVVNAPGLERHPEYTDLSDEGLVTLDLSANEARIRLSSVGTGVGIDYVFSDLETTYGDCGVTYNGTLVMRSRPAIVRHLTIVDNTRSLRQVPMVCEMYPVGPMIEVRLEMEDFRLHEPRVMQFVGKSWFAGRVDFLLKDHAYGCLPNDRDSNIGVQIDTVVPVRQVMDMREVIRPRITLARLFEVENGEEIRALGSVEVSMEYQDGEVSIRDAVNQFSLELVKASRGAFRGELRMGLGEMTPAFITSSVTCHALR